MWETESKTATDRIGTEEEVEFIYCLAFVDFHVKTDGRHMNNVEKVQNCTVSLSVFELPLLLNLYYLYLYCYSTCVSTSSVQWQ